MGLDLSLNRKRDFLEGKCTEDLAYGRKTWAISQWFSSRSQEVENHIEVYEISEKTWNEFMDTFSLERKGIEKYLAIYDDYDRGDSISEAEGEMAYKRLKRILDKHLNGTYCLGVDWEAHAILDWLDADEDVRAALADGGVVMILDY